MGKKNEKEVTPVADRENEAEKSREKENEPEIPDSVTLTRDEFIKVKDRIDALEKENADNVILLQRLQADFDNYRKRNATLSADSLEEGTRNLIKALLPVLDDLDRALEVAPEGLEGKDNEWVNGIRLVRTKLCDTLKKNGLEEIGANGCFDPDLHHAVLQEEAEGKESGEILEVLQKGYKVKNRIVRHTMVKVAK